MEVDGHSDVKVVNALDHVAITASADGEVIDTHQDDGYESIEYLVHVSVAATADGSNFFTSVLEESDVVTFGGEETVVPAEHTLGAAILVNDEDADDQKVFRQGSIGKKQFQRLTLIETGTSAITVGAVALLGNPKKGPVADQST